jgi:predicted transcriptional regulator
MSQKIKLTEVEHEIMQILWHLSEGSVNDVLAELPKERNLAYTSVSTILRILEQKKIVTARKEKRKHIYVPLIAKNDYQHTALDKLVENVFSGKSVELVNYLIDSSKLSVDEIKSIKKMLNDKLKEH